MFNRSTLKYSYSCTGNTLNIVKNHNAKILAAEKSGGGKTNPRNCRDKNNCLLSGECQAEGIVYSAEVSDVNGLNRNLYRLHRKFV